MWRDAKKAVLGACAGLAMLISGCGSSNPNVVSVTVTPSATQVIAGQVTNFTATVGGSTTLTVQWTCGYTYLPLPTTANPTPKAVTGTCTSGSTLNGGNVGSWVTSTSNSSNVLTYTAPSLGSFPNPIPVLTFTAAADADTKKTGAGQVALDTGIRVSVTPTSATVPVGITPPQKATFSVSLLNTDPSSARYIVVQSEYGIHERKRPKS